MHTVARPAVFLVPGIWDLGSGIWDLARTVNDPQQSPYIVLLQATENLGKCDKASKNMSLLKSES